MLLDFAGQVYWTTDPNGVAKHTANRFWASQTGLEPGAHFTDYLVPQRVIDLKQDLSGYRNESFCMISRARLKK